MRSISPENPPKRCAVFKHNFVPFNLLIISIVLSKGYSIFSIAILDLEILVFLMIFFTL